MNEGLMEKIKLGFAGNLSKTFIKSKLTPVIIVTSLLIGLMAVFLTPKEEEPQISVPMIDVMVSAPGLTPEEMERKVTEPIERAVWGLDGVEYVYSTSQSHMSLVTVRFKVGEPIEPSLVKVHHKIMEIRGQLPQQSQSPQIKSYSIDDVPFLVLTFTSKNLSDYELRSAVAPLARELSSTPDLARVELLGGQKRAVRVIADTAKLSQRGVSLLDIHQALNKNDASVPAGKNWSDQNLMDVEVGGRYKNANDIRSISVGQRGGTVVRLSDVAEIKDGPEERSRFSILIEKNQREQKAVSIVFAKRKGTNVVDLSKQILNRADVFLKEQEKINPQFKQIKMVTVRDYGLTAEDKSVELIEHLLIAILSVSILIALFMGIRAALVVAIAIPVTLALTLAIYYFMGYTLNRVTLFALIFSIGILVDDAIVVVENIERHLKESKDNIVNATLKAVGEVGNPTILATFTVIAAILPMAFVRGLMGPYMAPIPVGASFAMILSLFIAFIVTPWASVKLLKHESSNSSHDQQKTSKMDQLYHRLMDNLLTHKKSSLKFGLMVVTLLLGSFVFIYFKWVKVKMLPFDNKQEFQVLIDYPTSTSLQQSEVYSTELAQKLLSHPEVEKVQIFGGEAAPYSFSGMVKHTFLRQAEYQNDLQVLLTDKSKRKESSHEIIEKLRPIVIQFARDKKAVTKVLEIPPGPPVLATMIAEVYGPNREAREKAAKEVEQIFANEPSVVDLDTSMRPLRQTMTYSYDQSRGGELGTSATEVMMLGRLVFSENKITTLQDVSSPEEISVDLSLNQKNRSSERPFKDLRIPSFETGSVMVENVLKVSQQKEGYALYRKNLKPVSYVMSEMSGAEEAPVYGIMKLEPQIKYPVQTAEVPWDTVSPVVKWDGEWFITYEVFRDLGGAFAVVMVLIYVLVLGWFRSFSVPLIIMAPIPISLIGIIPGHAIFNSYFTATSMIGFIAGAGIIVRNSIILVDFIEHQLANGMQLKEAVISAGVLRFRPMLLTAAAVVVGSSVMLADPIFQGLAISLIFGEVAATFLSRFAVPILYYWLVGKTRFNEIRLNQNTEEVL